MEAARHDLHSLLHPEHLCAVFQQGLPCGHDKIHDAAAQLFIGKRVSAVHCLLSLQKMIPYFIMCTSRIQGCIKKTGAAKGRKQYSYQKTSLGVLTNAADGVIIVSISQKWL